MAGTGVFSMNFRKGSCSMKKALRFIRSMRFGLMLLAPVLVCTVIGSVIPQGESESLYAANFPGAYHLILGLGLDHVFSGPVFLILTALFGLNLTFCSVWQLRTLPDREQAVIRRAERSEPEQPLDPTSRQRLEEYLARRRWRRTEGEGRTLFVSPAAGWYGSVVTHFALVLLLLGAAGIFLLTTAEDHSLMPGDNDLPNGVRIRLDDFKVKDESGRIDYVSTLEVTDSSGRSSGVRQIRVNKPLRFGSNKYYQQSYGVCGELQVTVNAEGKTYPVHMTESGMISLGGTDGVWYDNVYPGYVEEEDGSIQVLTQTTGEYPDPIYYVIRMTGGEMQPMFAFPGDTLETSDAVYPFLDPVTYPAVRVKTTPVWVYALLYASFVLLVLGLYLCFFAPAAVVAVGEEGYTVAAKSSDAQLREQLSVFLKGESTHA